MSPEAQGQRARSIDRGNPIITNHGGQPAASLSATASDGTAISPERTEPGRHACQHCNARFTRMEHLKRHVTSLHSSHSAKQHCCQLCGKRFSRRDVLLRHFQSCRTVRASNHQAGSSPAADKRAPQKHLEARTDDSRWQGPVDPQVLNYDSNYSIYPKPGRGQDSQVEPLLWPLQEADESELPIDGDGHGYPGALSDTVILARPHASHGLDSNAFNTSPADPKPGLTLQQDGNGFESVGHSNSNTNGQRDVWSTDVPQAESFLPSDALTRRMTDAGNPSASQVCGSVTTDELPSPKGRRPANRRGRYVSTACGNCHKRKVKCSGEDPCLQCRLADMDCVYNHGRHGRKRRATTQRLIPQKPKHAPIAAADDSVNLTQSLSQMLERIANLERDCNTFRSQVADATKTGSISSASQHEDELPYSMVCDSPINVTSLPPRSIFHGATCMLEPIDVLNRTIVGEGEKEPDSGIETQSSQGSPIEWRLLSRGDYKDIKAIEIETRCGDPVGLRQAIDTFFTHLNPHYPSLNENYFRRRLEKFLANDTDGIAGGDWYQFVALLNLIKAEVKLMTCDWRDSNDVPAWEDFCRAEATMIQLIWLGNGNIWTIQCLLIKARYLYYCERADCAYETMGQIVRLCFLVGLHDQPSWKGCSPFETVIRQRLFWTVFFLERNVALNVGAPYLIRENDFRVDLPKNYDDKDLFPDRPLPEEQPHRSSAPYQACTAKWGKLASEIWDNLFGIGAQKPTSQEFVASMDARILYTVSQFPGHLKWLRNIDRLDGISEFPHFVLRQTMILHLRMNQLRLLLRQESMLSLKYDDQTAEKVISITASSINAMHDHYGSSVYTPSERWSSVLFLTGALLPLVCVIVKSDNPQQRRADAIDLFKKGLYLLYQMAPNFGVARHSLARLQHIIGSVTRAIDRFHSNQLFSVEAKQMDAQHLLPEFTELFNTEYSVDPERDIFNEQLNGPLTLNMNSLDSDLSGTDHLDKFWVDDFLNNRTLLFPDV